MKGKKRGRGLWKASVSSAEEMVHRQRGQKLQIRWTHDTVCCRSHLPPKAVMLRTHVITTIGIHRLRYRFIDSYANQQNSVLNHGYGDQIIFTLIPQYISCISTIVLFLFVFNRPISTWEAVTTEHHPVFSPHSQSLFSVILSNPKPERVLTQPNTLLLVWVRGFKTLWTKCHPSTDLNNAPCSWNEVQECCSTCVSWCRSPVPPSRSSSDCCHQIQLHLWSWPPTSPHRTRQNPGL